MKKWKPSNLLLLHTIVFIYGFTGILGRLIETGSDALVWWRMLIASLAIAVYAYSKHKIVKSLRTHVWIYCGIGMLIAAHWITFFEAIKQSNVSVTLACLSASSLFTAILEPILFKRKLNLYELFFGLLVVSGLLLIFNFETQYQTGIYIALGSAFLASLFTTLNGVMIKNDNPYRISLVEMMAGVGGISIWLFFRGKLNVDLFDMPYMDWIWILLLGLLATAFAFVVSVKVLEELTPFTVSLTINLEPVYGIVLAFFIFGSSEQMTGGFYAGTLLILSALYLNALLKKGRLQRWSKWVFGRISHYFIP